MQAEDIPDLPPTYQESTPSASGLASSTRTNHILFSTTGLLERDALFFPILNIPSEESNDIDSDHGHGDDISDSINANGITFLQRLQRTLLRSSFTTLIYVFCTIFLLICITNNAITELDSVTSALSHLAAGETLHQILTNEVPTSVALNFTTLANRDSFLILSTAASNAALNWKKLNCDVGHPSDGDRCCPLFDALYDFANTAIASSRERQMLLATLESVLDTMTEIVNSVAVGAEVEAQVLEDSVQHLVVGELHSKLTRAITAADTFDTTLLAANAAFNHVRLHYRNEEYSLTRTTNTILAVIRGSKDIDARKKDLLRQLNGYDVPAALAYMSSMQQVVFQIKARLVELKEQARCLDNIYDGKVTGWQVEGVERVWRRVECSMSVLRG